jgi:hypothetical protein
MMDRNQNMENAMDDDDELTTIQITKRTSRLLARLAKAYERSKIKQVTFMVDNEADKLARYKLLPEDAEPLPSVDDVA